MCNFIITISYVYLLTYGIICDALQRWHFTFTAIMTFEPPCYGFPVPPAMALCIWISLLLCIEQKVLPSLFNTMTLFFEAPCYLWSDMRYLEATSLTSLPPLLALLCTLIRESHTIRIFYCIGSGFSYSSVHKSNILLAKLEGKVQ